MTDIFFDIMDTVVVDPYMTALPEFFGLTFAELVAQKDRSLWPKFERGEISEDVFVDGYFPDERAFDAAKLHEHLKRSYTFVPGMEALLQDLQSAGNVLHAFTNYPSWFKLVEEALVLSRYLNWTVVSCQVGSRKPEREIYEFAMSKRTSTSQPWFIDDRSTNVAAADDAGFVGVEFNNAELLRVRFERLGLV